MRLVITVTVITKQAIITLKHLTIGVLCNHKKENLPKLFCKKNDSPVFTSMGVRYVLLFPLK